MGPMPYVAMHRARTRTAPLPGRRRQGSVPPEATAYAHRDAAYLLEVIARSPEREGFEEHADWARATQQAMGPWATGGGYVNFTSEPGQDKVQASYPPDTCARLVAVKDQDDPTDLFRLDQNIRPSGRRRPTAFPRREWEGTRPAR